MKRILWRACAPWLVAIVLICAASPATGQIAGVDTGFISSMTKALGGNATPQQAEGAAGAIFGLAKSRLSPADFSKVSSAVPGMDGLLKAAPAQPVGALGGLSGLSSLSSSFTTLGLSPEAVSKAIPVVTNYVTKSGGADVGKMLAGVLK
jgi:hypothetical protein